MRIRLCINIKKKKGCGGGGGGETTEVVMKMSNDENVTECLIIMRKPLCVSLWRLTGCC